MALRLRDRHDEATVEWIDNWPFTAQVDFIDSNAFQFLKRELAEYVSGRVPGRAFLVAGHRGAGKTTLVARAVEDLSRDILKSAWRSTDANDRATQRSVPRQRPLMVRLHGPSLLVQPKADDGKVVAPDMALALEQIMIALYRALAEEAGRCMTHLANERWRERKSRHVNPHGPVEVAAQFLLELDNAPKPALLRAFYNRLGSIESGIFWPIAVALAAVRNGIPDQGMRELVALTTGAQAFEVCAGEVKSTDTTTTSRSTGRVTELKLDASLADVLNKAIGALIGVATGAAALTAGSGIALAAASGVAASVITAASYSWSTKRSTTDERKTDYTFIKNRTKQSLDRDLPGVVRRIREAGLAPIFVIDELDKINDPDEAIANFIGSVKHLTTDFGAFCFLTDRAYLETLLDRVRSKKFPLEHSYFSHWLLILNEVDDILDYLERRLVSDVAPPPMPQRVSHSLASGAGGAESEAPEIGNVAEREADNLSRSILALYLVHRSRLNSVDLFRELGRLSDRRGEPYVLREPFGTSFRHRTAATFQLAIRAILRRPILADRIAAEPHFARLAIDALYMVSRAWEAGEKEVVVNRAAIVAELSRVGGAQRDSAASVGESDSEQSDTPLISEYDLDLLEDQVLALVGHLGDLRSFASMPEAALSGTLTNDPRRIIPLELVEALVEPVDGDAQRLRFVLNAQGRRVAQPESPEGPNANGHSATVQLEQVDAVEALLHLLNVVGLNAEILVALSVFPPAMNGIALLKACQRLRRADATKSRYEEQEDDIQLLAVAGVFLERKIPELVDLLGLLLEMWIVSGTQGATSLSECLHAVARYVDLPTIFEGGSAGQVTSGNTLSSVVGRPTAQAFDSLFRLPPSTREPSESVAESLRAITSRLEEYRRNLSAEVEVRVGKAINAQSIQAAWDRWADRLKKHVAQWDGTTPSINFVDLMTAVAGTPPGALFQRNLAEMTAADWTRVFLVGFPTDKSDVPGWVWIVGLWGLGFGRRLLERAVEFTGTIDETSQGLIRSLLADASDDNPRGIILVLKENSVFPWRRFDAQAEEYGHSASRTLLAVRHSDFDMYDHAFAWLEKHDVLEGLVYEQQG